MAPAEALPRKPLQGRSRQPYSGSPGYSPIRRIHIRAVRVPLYLAAPHLTPQTSPESPGAKLGDNLRRIFVERGLDFFEQDAEERQANKEVKKEKEEKDNVKPDEGADSSDVKPMSLEELDNMRMELLPQLQ